MPTAPPHPCAQRGCPALTTKARCPAHTTERYQQDQERRGTAAQRGYGPHWAQTRGAYLKAHPSGLCAHCGQQGTTVDHIIPRARGGTDHHQNLQLLCAPCHGRKTARHDRGFGRPAT